MDLFRDVHRTLSTRYPIDGVNMPTSEWLVQNTHYGLGRFSFDGYQFQMQIADDDHPNLACKKCSQVGLSLALDTPVPTPTGWTTMGEVQVGDTIFDEKGQPTQVTFISEIYTDHPCYRITFDTGEEIVADENHRWYVEADRAFDLTGRVKMGRPSLETPMFKTGVLNTKQIAQFHKQGARNRFAIPNAEALKLPETLLPVDPYFLGLWLGDGSSGDTTLTGVLSDLKHHEVELTQRGLTVEHLARREIKTPQVRVKDPQGNLRAALQTLGVFRDKHVPAVYLRASTHQRLDLLRGLLDTDGSITKRGRVSFYNTNPRLVAAVEELACSLGFKTRTRWRPVGAPSTTKNGHVITPTKSGAEVSFVAYAEDDVFLMPRKRARLTLRSRGRPSEAMRRRIVKVEPVDPVPTRCLQVDAPSHLFLAGRAMVPTHNTETQIRKFFAWLKRHPNTTGIFTLPSEKLFKRISKMRIKPWLATEEVFNSGFGDQKPSRSMDMYQVDSSFAVISGLTEDDATSTSADILFHDELDLSDMKMIDLAQSRLQNSDYKITQAFSTPKYPGYGIDGRYAISDQHEYMYKCQSCNHHNIPDFAPKFLNLSSKIGYHGPEDILEASDDQINAIQLNELHVCCERCRKPLDLRDHSSRFWVAKYPARDLVRGYMVMPFSTHRIPPRYILGRLLAARRENAIGGFYNTVLGRAYVDGNAQLSEEEIRACFGAPGVQEVGQGVPCFVGIDVGETCHIVCGPLFGQTGGTATIRSCQIGKLFDVLAELHEKYNIVGGTIDRHPQSHVANAVHDRWPGILPCEYRGTAPLKLVISQETGEATHCQVDRTDAIDRVVKAIREKSLLLEGFGAQAEILITHLRNMVREEEPETPAKWVKLAEDDHYFHALVFFLVGPRMLELLFDHTSSSMLSAIGVFGVEDLIIDTSQPRPGTDFIKPEPAALSVRARMQSKGQNLWQA